jgi:competence protein ComEC
VALKIHFLNVGHGDCTFIEFPSGRLGMVDVNNTKSIPDEDRRALFEEAPQWYVELAKASATRSWEDYYKDKMVDPFEYHRDKLDGRAVFRYIQTHPDMDHMSGFHQFFKDGSVDLGCMWDTKHTKELDSADFENSGYEEVDWLLYSLRRLGRGPYGTDFSTLNIEPGSQNNYWQQDGITILSPTETLVKACDIAEDWNNMSYVLRIDHAGRSVILPGDACAVAWDSILANWPVGALDCDVLKAAHHGRKSGFHDEAVDAMDPSVVICSVGKKPDTDASAKYAAKGADVFSTRYHGTITVTIWDDGDIWVRNDGGGNLATITS